MGAPEIPDIQILTSVDCADCPTDTGEEVFIPLSGITSPDEIFDDGLSGEPPPIEPLTPEEARGEITTVASCDNFDPADIQRRLETIVQSDEFPRYQWGYCGQAAIKGEQLLHSVLADYEPEYRLVWGLGTTRDGVTGNFHHTWVETEVCDETFVTDLTQDSDAGTNLGFQFTLFENLDDITSYVRTFATNAPHFGYVLATFQTRVATDEPICQQGSIPYLAAQAEALGNIPHFPAYKMAEAKWKLLVAQAYSLAFGDSVCSTYTQ